MEKSKKKRACASCSACCVYLRIDSKPGFSTRLDTGEDVAKKQGEPCRFLGANGCSIYEVRPVVCRQFRCDWLLGRKDFDDDDSPLQVGYLGVRGDLHFLK